MIPDGRDTRATCEDSRCPDCEDIIAAATAWHDAHGYRHGFVNGHRCPKSGLYRVHCVGYVPDQGYIDCHARAVGATREEALEAMGGIVTWP